MWSNSCSLRGCSTRSAAPRRPEPACGAASCRSARKTGFAWDVEVIAIALRLGIGVQELAIEWRHDDGSRLRMIRDGTAMVAAVPRIRHSIGRVPRAGRRPESTQWWIRSTGAYMSSIVAPLAKSDGWLVTIGSRSTMIAGRVGWRLQRTVAIESPSARAASSDATAVQVLVGDGRRIPIADGAARVVCLLEVLQGVDDETLLTEAAHVLGRDGTLIVTVPGLSALTPRGALLCRRGTLRRHLNTHGFEVVWTSHLFGWLTPAAVAGRTSSWVQGEDTELQPAGPIADRLALVLARLEVAIIRRVPLPLGTSIVCVAASRADPPERRLTITSPAGSSTVAHSRGRRCGRS